MSTIISKISRFTAVVVGLVVVGFSASAQDTITFTWKGGINKQFSLIATEDKHFTIYWGNGLTTDMIGIGTSNWQTVSHVYSDSNDYTVNIIGSAGCLLGALDCSFRELSNLDVHKNTALVRLNCYGNQLINLDLNGCSSLRYLHCYNNQLRNLNLNGCNSLTELYCNNNQCPLSDLYAASGRVSTTNNARLGPQFLPMQQVVVDDIVDYSSQAKFNTTNTVFVVEKDYIGGTKASVNFDYTINNGVIVFKKGGKYFVNMTNTAIKTDPNYPAIVYAEFNVVTPPNTDATLASLTVSEGVLNPIFDCYTFNYMVDVANNISKITINAVPTDTNATISGDIGLQQLKTGMNIFTITVTAEDKTTTRNYTITVNRADTMIDSTGIREITQEHIKIYPNPTSGKLRIENGELMIENVELFDVYGKSILRHCERSEAIQKIDISHLANGMYYLKIGKKIVKVIKE